MSGEAVGNANLGNALDKVEKRRSATISELDRGKEARRDSS